MKTNCGPLGIHMFDRISGLNVLLDEVAVPNDRWSPAPKYVSFALTNACELTCPYCYAAKRPARLLHEKVIEWAMQLDAAGCFGLGFGGGEPTLYPNFSTLCRELRQKTKLALTMTTHGHRFNPALVRELSGSLDFIRLSMDGIGLTYERLRGRSFDSFKEKLALVRETARFGINYVVNDMTVHELDDAAEYVFESGASELLLLPEIDKNGAVNISSNTSKRLSLWVQENYSRCRLASSAHGGDIIDAPILPISDRQNQSYEFMHLDAFHTLKLSAFDQRGISVDGMSSVLEAIRRLRDGAAIRANEGISL